MIQIGLTGIAFSTGNKGCEALAYSFLEVLDRIADSFQEHIEVNLISAFPTRRWIKEKMSIKRLEKYYQPKQQYKCLSFVPAFYYRHRSHYLFSKKAKSVVCVFDFTDGDSFSDIYGLKRFYQRTAFKKAIIDAGIPLVLGSQTIGPFQDEMVEKFACLVIRECYEVYARDEISYLYTREISGREPVLTSDIAFFLPFEQKNKSKNGRSVGFNPSGLLWNGGYNRKNQFNLTVDYLKYCDVVIHNLLDDGYEVHLILHAYNEDLSLADNDLVAVSELKKMFPSTIVSPKFDTPMEAKSYISGLDFFIGARMHATIASLSAAIPVIPFSYSRKFEGLFESLDYPYIISGTKMSTEESIRNTIDWIKEKEKIKEAVEISASKIKTNNDALLEDYTCLIKNLINQR
ncbi:MAG: polysaccharide pyruvyl transferase family protein [Lachnospiraceae bacterium]|nr:polysaccharide pyruvyl transferase family protein [Lachnospiraceae bacterium]